MTRPVIKNFVRRSLLEKADPELLVRFLRPYRDFLLRRGVELDGIELDTHWIERLHGVLTAADPELPGQLQQALHDISELASDHGQQLARAPIGRRQCELFSRGAELCPEDLALTLYLDHRDSFVSSHARARAERVKQQVSFFPAERQRRVGLSSKNAQRQLSHHARNWFAGRNSTRFLDLQVVDDSRSTTYLFRHGQPPRSLDVVTSDVTRDRIAVIPAREDSVRLHKTTGELAITAGTQADLEFYRQAFGAVLFDDEDHFETRAIVSVQPLVDDMRAALSPDGIAGLELVEVRSLQMFSLTPPHESLAWNATSDIAQTLQGDIAVIQRRPQRSLQTKLALHLSRPKRPTVVELTEPNKVKWGQRQGREVVSEYLFSRGFLSLPDYSEMRMAS